MEHISPVLKKLINQIPVMHQALRIEFADESRLADMQLGYAVDMAGNDLSGTDEGDWCATWLVFGYDYGDPVFVDTEEQARGFPVYVAEHGMTIWEPQEIAKSFSALLRILQVLNQAMHSGEIRYKTLVAAIEPHTDNIDYWEVVIEGIEEALD